jgi:hypothetical protein
MAPRPILRPAQMTQYISTHYNNYRTQSAARSRAYRWSKRRDAPIAGMSDITVDACRSIGSGGPLAAGPGVAKSDRPGGAAEGQRGGLGDGGGSHARGIRYSGFPSLCTRTNSVPRPPWDQGRRSLRVIGRQRRGNVREADENRCKRLDRSQSAVAKIEAGRVSIGCLVAAYFALGGKVADLVTVGG